MFITHVATIVAKIGEWVKQHQHDLFRGMCGVLIAWSAYHIGQIRGHTPRPMTLTQGTVFQAQGTPTPPKSRTVPTSTPLIHTDLRVVVSKTSSSKKYHYTWCPGAQKIKETNKRWFQTAQLAEAAGYTLAATCSK